MSIQFAYVVATIDSPVRRFIAATSSIGLEASTTSQKERAFDQNTSDTEKLALLAASIFSADPQFSKDERIHSFSTAWIDDTGVCPSGGASRDQFSSTKQYLELHMAK